MIKQLNIDGFGRFNNKIISLSDGLNIICAKNGEGKSTVTAFIKAMLYGLPSSRSQDLDKNERLHYTPWSGEIMGGSLELKTEKQIIRIERIFGATASKDKLTVIDAVTGERLRSLENGVGEQIYGISMPTFETTAFIGQGRYRVEGTDEIRTRLSNIVSSASEDVSCKNAVTVLDKKRKYYTSKGGILPTLNFELAELQEEEIRLLRIQKEYGHLIEKSNDLEKQLFLLNKEEYSLQEQYNQGQLLSQAEDYNRIKADRKQIEQYENKIETLYPKLAKGGQYISDKLSEHLIGLYDETANAKAVLQKLNDRKLYEWSSLKNIENQQQRLNINSDCLSDLNKATALEKEINELKTKLSDRELAKAQLEYLKKQQTRFETPEYIEFSEVLKENPKLYSIFNSRFDKVSALFMITAFLSSAAAFFAQSQNMLYLTYFLHSLTGLFLISVFVRYINRKLTLKKFISRLGLNNSLELKQEYSQFLSDKEQYNLLEKSISDILKTIDAECPEEKLLNEKKEKLFILLNRYGFKNIQEFSSKSDSLKALLEQKSVQTASLSELQQEIINKEYEYTRIYSDALDCARSVFSGISSIDEIPIMLQTAIQAQIEIESLKALISEIESRIKAILKGRTEEELLPAVYPPKSTEKIDISNVCKQLDELTEQKTLLSKEIAETKAASNHFFDGLRSISDIQEEINLKNEQLAEINLRISAICTAIDGIKKAETVMQRSFAPKLNSRAGQFLCEITHGKYKGLMIDKDYNVRIEEELGSQAIGYYSAGTTDQIYLALRLSLISVMEENSEPLPLILDDSFSNFDDERLEASLNSILEISKERQVIIFSCQSRELNLLSKKGLSVNKIILN